MESLKGKSAIVTGAASGIGLGITAALVREGVSVAMLDLDEGVLKDAATDLSASNVRAHTYVCDVRDRPLMSQTAKRIHEDFGDIHILCNNAGIATGGAVQDLDYAAWDRGLGINLGGVVNGFQAFLPLLLEHGNEGHIVNTSSFLGLMSIPGQAVYSASKYAVIGLSEAARKDLEPKGIGVSVLCPALIATNIIKNIIRNEFRETAEGGTKSGSVSDLEAAHKVYQSDGLSTHVVAAQVLEAIKKNKPYIFTHADSRPTIENHFQEILACFDGNEA